MGHFARVEAKTNPIANGHAEGSEEESGCSRKQSVGLNQPRFRETEGEQGCSTYSNCDDKQIEVIRIVATFNDVWKQREKPKQHEGDKCYEPVSDWGTLFGC